MALRLLLLMGGALRLLLLMGGALHVRLLLMSMGSLGATRHFLHSIIYSRMRLLGPYSSFVLRIHPGDTGPPRVFAELHQIKF